MGDRRTAARRRHGGGMTAADRRVELELLREHVGRVVDSIGPLDELYRPLALTARGLTTYIDSIGEPAEGFQGGQA